MRGGLLFFCLLVSCAAQVYTIETVAGFGQPGFGGDSGPAYRAQLNQPSSIAFDSSGRLYVADTGNNRVRRIDTAGTITTVAGNGEPGNAGDLGPAVDAAITVVDIAFDPQGTYFIGGGSWIRAINPEGVIWTIAGPELGVSDVTSIALESSGTILAADAGKLRRIAREGAVTDLPLSGITDPVTEVAIASDGGIYFVAGQSIHLMDASGAINQIAVEFPVNAATRLAVDRMGELHVSSERVWKLAGGRSWVLAGLDVPGYGGDNGPGVLAQVNAPGGLVVDVAANVYFADTGNNRVRLLRAPFAGSISAIFPSARAVGIWPRNVVLQWTPLANAEYEIWFGSDPNSLTRLGTVNTNSYTLPALDNTTTYYWRISTRFVPLPAVNSPLFSFTTTVASDSQPPEIPGNPQPANSSLGLPTALLLTWNGSGASRYEIYLDTSEYVVQRVGVSQEPQLFVRNLRPNTKYYWRVQALNDRGQSVSRRWEFTTGSESGYPYVIDTFAGMPLPRADGTVALDAALGSPRTVVIGASGEVIFVDGGRRVRWIDRQGKLSTLYTSQSGDIVGLATNNNNGDVFAALNEVVLRIPKTGRPSVVAGQPGRTGYSGDAGAGNLATLSGISAIAADRTGSVYIADTANHRVRVVRSDGAIRTYAGTGECAEAEISGNATSLPLCSPGALALDSEGNLYVAASGAIVRVRVDGTVEPVTAVESVGGMTVDNRGNVLFLDAGNMMLRRIRPDGALEDVAGEPDADGRAFGFFGDGLPAARARFAFPEGVTTDPAGNVYIADTGNHRIRRIDTEGFLNTIAGTDTVRGERGGSLGVSLYMPTDVAIDATGNVYVADSGNNRIRRVSPTRVLDTPVGGGTEPVADVLSGASRVGRLGRDLRIDLSTGGVVKTDESGNVLFADSRFSRLSADGTAAIYVLDIGGAVRTYLDSHVRHVGGIARGRAGEIYVSDTLGHRILRIDEAGVPTVLAGTGSPGFVGDGGPAVVAQVHTPRALTISPSGELHVAEFGRVRRITNDGRIVTVLNEHAGGIAHDRLGTLYLTAGRSVYALSEGGQLRRIAGQESAPEGPNDGGLALRTRLNEPRGLAATPDGDIFFADAGDHLVRRLVPNVPSSITITSGNGQMIEPNQPAQPFRVRITGRTGQPVPGVSVTFTATNGTASPVVIATATTNNDGIATIAATTRGVRGQVTVTASATGLAPVHFNVTVP